MLAENKSLVDALVGPENNKGCSGGGNNLDWVAAYIAARYGYANGVVGMAYLSMPTAVWPEGWITAGIELAASVRRITRLVVSPVPEMRPTRPMPSIAAQPSMMPSRAPTFSRTD